MSVVFITGGGRRLGRALALQFAEHGFDVGITYNTSEAQGRETVEEIVAMGRRATCIRADVSRPDSLDAAYDALVAELGAPDVVISNAGVFPPADPHPTADDVRRAIDVNTLPLVTLARCIERHRTDDVTRLVAISSLGGTEIWRDRLAYNVSKSALNTAVRSLARTMAPLVLVNAIAPGAIEQPNERTKSDSHMAAEDRIPMGRYGTATDVFEAVWFFSSTSYITGQILHVDGGYGLVR